MPCTVTDIVGRESEKRRKRRGEEREQDERREVSQEGEDGKKGRRKGEGRDRMGRLTHEPDSQSLHF